MVNKPSTPVLSLLYKFTQIYVITHRCEINDEVLHKNDTSF